MEDAVEVLQASPLFVGEDFRQTAAAVQEGAFAATGEFTDKLLGEVRDKLTEHLETGLDHNAFIADAVSILNTSEAHADQIFRNNIGAALSQGAERALRHPLVVDAFPYRRYRATHDDRVRPEHLALEFCGLDGTAIYNMNDPAWLALAPPWSWNCRCAWAPVSVAKAARWGVQEAIDWLARAEAMADEQGGRAASYFLRTAPAEFQFVPWPTYEGQRIEPSPEWRRGGIAGP
jgi:SPP1 gp7 family putative phage head morphogenesis protein